MVTVSAARVLKADIEASVNDVWTLQTWPATEFGYVQWFTSEKQVNKNMSNIPGWSIILAILFVPQI